MGERTENNADTHNILVLFIPKLLPYTSWEVKEQANEVIIT